LQLDIDSILNFDWGVLNRGIAMAGEFDPFDAELRLRNMAEMLTYRLERPVLPDETDPIVTGLMAEITDQLGLRLDSGRFRPGPLEIDGGLTQNLPGLFQSVSRTLSFARKNHIGGVPTLVPEDFNDQDREAPVYTIIDVFDRDAIARIARDAQRRWLGPPPDPAVDDRQFAEWLEFVCHEHPWARISDDAAVARDFGTNFSTLFARNLYAAANGQPTTVNYSVNTQTTGLVLDAFPELQYAPRRFGSKVSTPVHGQLRTGWWKFETMIGGALVRDKGRHLASSTSTSTTTRDF